MPFAPFSPGTILSRRYEILSLIRKGGMGITYRGLDRETGATVAIKELLDEFENPVERESGITNFLAEMSVLRGLHHPQIPKLIDHFVEKSGFFIILEFIEGKDCSEKLDQTGAYGLPEDEVIHLGIHVCRVLSYLHSRHPKPVVHRDIKPSNIMERNQDHRIMLVDFGIAWAAKPREGMMIGSFGYSPPEQHQNQWEPRSDIYALGATLHELSTGQKPNPEAFAFLSPSEYHAELSLQFSETILKGVNYYPKDRYSDALSFENALNKLLPKPLPPLVIDPFDEARYQLEKSLIIPFLRKTKKHYVNECQTPVLPEEFDYFVFTLGTSVSHSLIIQSVPEHQSLRFLYRHGLLSPTLLGEVNLLLPESFEKTEAILDRFVNDYVTSRGF